MEAGYNNVTVLAGGVNAWKVAGFKTAQGLDATLCEPNDVVLSPSIRGSKEDMQNYLNWELKLKD
jgi:3-mercaptopyruvate sulfurtransferase SseA